MSEELEDILTRSRRVYRAGSRGGEEPVLAVPAGFAERVVRNRKPERTRILALYERVAYLGAACALAIALLVPQRGGSPEASLAVDPWMEMPMVAQQEGGRP